MGWTERRLPEPRLPAPGTAPLNYFLGGLDETSYRELLRRAIVGGHDPENVILMEIHPEEQKTLPDFLLTEKMLGIKTVDIEAIKKDGVAALLRAQRCAGADPEDL